MRSSLRPVMAFAKPGVMVPSIFSATGLSPLKEIVDASVATAEREPSYLDVSVFAGFSYADVPNCGFSVLAVADRRERAEAAVADLTRRIYEARRALLHPDLVLDMDAAMERATALAGRTGKPVVLLEHADRCNDSTYLLRELLRRGIRNAAVPYIWDPVGAAFAAEAGIGNRVTLEVGGHSSDRAGGPVRLTGTVVFVGEKSYRTTGAYMNRRLVELGLSAVLDVDGLMLSLVSCPAMTVDEDPFIQFGMRAQDFEIIVLRSKTHFRAVSETLAEAILIVDTPDWGPADLTTLPYRQVPTERIHPFNDHGRPNPGR